jgi:hypothetical protein
MSCVDASASLDDPLHLLIMVEGRRLEHHAGAACKGEIGGWSVWLALPAGRRPIRVEQDAKRSIQIATSAHVLVIA